MNKGSSIVVKAAFRKLRNRYIAELTELLPWGLSLYARYKCSKPPEPPTRWRKALILGDNHVGDLLYRTSSLEYLKKGIPNCDIYYLAAPGSAEVLKHNPWIKAVLPLCRSDSRLDLSASAFRKLREIGFDAAICSNPIHYYQDLKLALDLKIPTRVGYTFKGLSAWVTHPMPIQYPKPFPSYFRDMVAQLTNQSPNWPLCPKVYTSDADEEAAEVLWRTFKFNESHPVIACFMTSRQPEGNWPEDCFAQAFQLLANRREAQLLLCGSENETALLERINRDYRLNAAVNAGRIGLRSLVCMLRRCATVISPDSGPRHLANAAGVPVVFLSNFAANRIETGTYCETEHDVAPVGSTTPQTENEALLRRTTAEVLAGKVMDILSHRRTSIA